MESLIDVIKIIGSVSSALLAVISILPFALKPLRNKLNEFIKKASGYEDVKMTLLAQLRNTITYLYFKYLNVESIPDYEKENLNSLYERYESLGGNSYIKHIYAEMMEWKTLSTRDRK